MGLGRRGGLSARDGRPPARSQRADSRVDRPGHGGDVCGLGPARELPLKGGVEEARQCSRA
eukprot:336849-Pleurochrysis_carterae.AAC.1